MKPQNNCNQTLAEFKFDGGPPNITSSLRKIDQQKIGGLNFDAKLILRQGFQLQGDIKGAYTPTKEKRACNSHRADCIHQNSNDPYPFTTIFSNTI